MMAPLLIDLDEAAAMLSLSRRSVQQLIYSGVLASVKLGRRRLVAVADLETFVARLRQDSEHIVLKVV